MKTSLKTSQFWNTMALATAMFAASPSLAQVHAVSAEGSGHSGGGNVTESDFRSYMAKLDTYLMSVEGKTTFPEIVAYDAAHPSENFHQLILSTQPTVKSMDLVDQFGESRDCMSYAQPGLRYFVCDSRKLPEKTLANQPSFYRIILHELFVQAGIEKPMSKAVSSDYSVSYRITQNVHLETYQEWVPGKAAARNFAWVDCRGKTQDGSTIIIDLYPARGKAMDKVEIFIADSKGNVFTKKLVDSVARDFTQEFVSLDFGLRDNTNKDRSYHLQGIINTQMGFKFAAHFNILEVIRQGVTENYSFNNPIETDLSCQLVKHIEN